MKKLFLFIAAATLIWAAAPQEPSAFGAGNLDSGNPYGLSEDEKHILANKKAIERLQKTLLRQQQILERNTERIDGMQSLLEGLNDRLRRYEAVTKQMADLNRSVTALQETDEKNFRQIRAVLKELGAMIDSINDKYVDKERFDALEKSFLSFKKSYESYIKKRDFSKKSKRAIFLEAKRLFSKKSYDAAAERFEYLIKSHYKPATSNYYLGEIAYRQGRYADAVTRYKKSASLYDKSSFMPTLLFHTAVSLQRLGKKSEAKKFYKSVIELYPKSKAASLAKRYLAKLK